MPKGTLARLTSGRGVPAAALAVLLAALLAASLAALGGPALAQQSQNPSFNLVNRSRLVIERVYASPAGRTDWGRDQLGDDQVEPGGRYAIRLPADGNCIYDVRVEYANGTSDERRGINTCTVEDVAFPSGGGGGGGGNGGGRQQQQTGRDPSFRVVNQGRTEVTSVFASPTGEREWGRDRLGDATIPAGRSRVIRMPQGQCMYDVRVVFSDNAAVERRNMNLCEITDLPVR